MLISTRKQALFHIGNDRENLARWKRRITKTEKEGLRKAQQILFLENRIEECKKYLQEHQE